MIITTQNHILLDGRDTGLGVSQERGGTRVYRRTGGLDIELPQQRYALSHDAPVSGVAGRAQFESDLRAALANG